MSLIVVATLQSIQHQDTSFTAFCALSGGPGSGNRSCGTKGTGQCFAERKVLYSASEKSHLLRPACPLSSLYFFPRGLKPLPCGSEGSGTQCPDPLFSESESRWPATYFFFSTLFTAPTAHPVENLNRTLFLQFFHTLIRWMQQ